MHNPKNVALLAFLTLLCPLAAFSSKSAAQDGNVTDVSMEQLYQAEQDNRPLTPQERSYLRGVAYGIFGYVAHQQLMGWTEHSFVCADQSQREVTTPEWLHRTMIQDTEDNQALLGYNISIVATYTLSKHFPCKNAPKINPDGFTDALEFINRKADAAGNDER